jgi:hypothetical protein
MSTLNGQIKLKYQDYDGEVSTVTLPVAALTAVNFDAQETARTALLTALADVLVGNLISWEHFNLVVDSVTSPSDKTAQRELAWRFPILDTVSLKTYSLQVPCPDMTLLNTAAKGELLMTSGAGATFAGALLAYGLTKDGNAMVADAGKLVGRNL